MNETTKTSSKSNLALVIIGTVTSFIGFCILLWCLYYVYLEMPEGEIRLYVIQHELIGPSWWLYMPWAALVTGAIVFILGSLFALFVARNSDYKDVIWLIKAMGWILASIGILMFLYHFVYRGFIVGGLQEGGNADEVDRVVEGTLDMVRLFTGFFMLVGFPVEQLCDAEEEELEDEKESHVMEGRKAWDLWDDVGDEGLDASEGDSWKGWGSGNDIEEDDEDESDENTNRE